MVVRNNVNGKRAQRYYGSTNIELGKTLEKLSSGYRINRSADDAAGLAISEKMRLQITGLGRARENSQDGVKLIQTGEGALQEVQDMLDRAEYLAVQSANGTYMDELDRDNLQKELDHLRSEIDRITTSANFNGIELFQDYGAAYERSTSAPDPAAMEYQKKLETLKKSENLVSQRLKTENTRQQAERIVSNSTQKQPALSSNKKLDDLLADQEKGDLNIVYIQDDAFSTTQTPEGTATSSYMVTENGVQKDLGGILKKEIIPNIVTNILNRYDAFSYLSESSIGIGLEYFHGNGTDQQSTLAYVEVGSAVWPSNNQVAYLTYKLGVNLDTIGSWNNDTREKLEATIAHEMIHAFMDEATTSGMLGRPVNPTTGLPSGQDDRERFPGWFREGMAQTASGHNNWIHPNAVEGLRLTASSTDDDIKAQIQDANKRLGSDTTASRYGTGYLACMYLGAVIAGGGQPSGTIDAATISSGLNQLLSAVIGGSSLNDAIKTLTNGTFSSMADFEKKFTSEDAAAENNAPGLCDFTRGLLTAIGSGRGGLVSGNLTDSDLAANGELSGVKLFELNTQNNKIKNEYPSDYPILSGGTVNKPGVAPSDFNTPAPPSQTYGDYVVSGTDLSGVSYDSTTGILTVDGGSNVTITLKSGVTTTVQGIVLKGTGAVTLEGVTMTGIVDVQNPNTKVAVSGNNNIGTFAMAANATADFTGSGKLTINSITGNNSNAIKSDSVDVIVSSGDISLKSLDIKNGDFSGPGKVNADTLVVTSGTLTAAGDIAAAELDISNGTVITNSGNGTITGNISVDGAAVVIGNTSSAALANSTYKDIDIPFQTGTNNISVLNDLASITIDGTTFGVPISKNTPNANLLLNNSSDHKVTFTDVNNSSKTLMATRAYETDGVTFDQFTWGLPPRPFTVTKADGTTAVEGQDFEYDADGTTLIIKQAGELTISGGVNNDDPANPIKGRIKLEDSISGNVELNLDGCTVDIADGCAFDLGTGNTVTLMLVDSKTNTFKSGSNYAGIAVGSGTALTITGTNNGELKVTGGTNAAGIGANYDTNLKDASAVDNSITINGGHIIATGGKYAAGLGAGYQTAFGDITINGGDIWARGNSMSAGIGGGYQGNIHNIEITGCDKIDAYASAGVGIGTGTNATGGDIIISGGKDIIAKGGTAAAGIGPDLNGSMGNIKISGGNITAVSGTQGAAIGAGPSAHVNSIIISEGNGATTKIKATGGVNGVGIGTGFNKSTCDSISITGGTIWAEGSQNSTGIGAGRDSTCGSITIGDASNLNSKIIVTAKGGMTNNGGNIMSYDDTGHTQAGTVKIFGDNTSVRPGNEGEGLYSTSGVTDGSGKRYSYPLHLFNNPPESNPLAAGIHVDTNPAGLLPLDHTKVPFESITISSDAGDSWTPGLSHSPDDNNYVFLWLKPQNQKLTIEYKEDGTSKTMTVDLIYYGESGVFRTAKQPAPSIPKPPGYIDDGPVTPGKPGDEPDTPNKPDTPVSPPPTEGGMGGIILQIGANYGEILEVPRFYLSVRALGLDTISIATQERAQKAMGVLRDAINRVSYIRGDYGALQNRLEHNINDLGQARENLSDAESRIRDADMAEEYTKFLKLNILQQSAQAMMAHSNEDANRVLQLLQ